MDFPRGDKAAGRDDRTASGRRYQETYYRRNKKRLSERAAARWRNNEGGYRERGLERARRKRSHARAQRAVEKFERQTANYRSGWWCRACDGRIPGRRRLRTCPLCGVLGALQRAILVTVALCDRCGRTSGWEGEDRPCRASLAAGKTCRGTMVEGEQVLTTKPPRLVRASDVGLPATDDGTDEAWVYSSGVLAAICGKSPSTIRTWIENRVVPGCSIYVARKYWFTEELMRAIAEGYRKTLFVDGRAPHGVLRRWIIQTIEERGVFYTPFPPK